MDEILMELVEFLKNASPVVWSALIRQVYVEAFSKIAWGIGLAALCYISVKTTKYAYNKTKDDSYSMWELGGIFLAILSVVVGIWSFENFVEAVKWFANPDFYAIRFILQQLGG